MHDEAVVEGRLWERTPPRELGLDFSGETLDFLVWVTAVDPKKPKEFVWKPELSKLTLGDRVFLYFAYAALREEGTHRNLDLPPRPVFLRHGLCRLAFPDDFAGVKNDEPPDFTPWMTGAGSYILEALQAELTSRWLQIERGKEDISDFTKMRSLGRSQERVLKAYYDAVEKANRLDLTRFVLHTAAGVLPPTAAAPMWVGGLQAPAGTRLADRTDTYRAATAFLRSLDRLAEWTNRARRVGYFDEGYAASQLWLTDWERCGGDARLVRAGDHPASRPVASGRPGPTTVSYGGEPHRGVS